MSGQGENEGSNDKPSESGATPARPYEVGRGKPPPDKQFQKGRSGNPKGRPREAKSQRDIVCSLLNRKVRITVAEGKTQRVTTREAALMRVVQKAVAGDMRAIDKVLDLAREYLPEDTRSDVAALFAEDAVILAAFKHRVQNGDG